jgi:glycosyltransferase involved in cell wall biosynthesis
MSGVRHTAGVSVCIATYNGERFVAEQVASVLSELNPDDELIIVDDCSKDTTVEILQSFGDPRIAIVRNETNQGPVRSFERAISLATREFICLADQDDRWVPGRVGLLISALERTGAMVASSNSAFMDGSGRPIDFKVDGVTARDSRKHLKNILGIFTGKTSYFGCAMAFRRSIVPLILPMPRYVESHDLWIALASNLIRSNVHVEEPTLIRRVHGDNASIIQRSLHLKLWARVVFALSLLVLTKRAAGGFWKASSAGQAIDA